MDRQCQLSGPTLRRLLQGIGIRGASDGVQNNGCSTTLSGFLDVPLCLYGKETSTNSKWCFHRCRNRCLHRLRWCFHRTVRLDKYNMPWRRSMNWKGGCGSNMMRSNSSYCLPWRSWRKKILDFEGEMLTDQHLKQHQEQIIVTDFFKE
jgi:hypothetical protein